MDSRSFSQHRIVQHRVVVSSNWPASLCSTSNCRYRIVMNCLSRIERLWGFFSWDLPYSGLILWKLRGSNFHCSVESRFSDEEIPDRDVYGLWTGLLIICRPDWCLVVTPQNGNGYVTRVAKKLLEGLCKLRQSSHWHQLSSWCGERGRHLQRALPEYWSIISSFAMRPETDFACNRKRSMNAWWSLKLPPEISKYKPKVFLPVLNIFFHHRTDGICLVA